MVVVVVERVKPGLRGALRRWMLEVQAGVYVGRLSLRVRDEVWQRIEREAGVGAAVMAETARNEQGFSIRVSGEPERALVDAEGLFLVARRKRCRAKGAVESPSAGTESDSVEVP